MGFFPLSIELEIKFTEFSWKGAGDPPSWAVLAWVWCAPRRAAPWWALLMVRHWSHRVTAHTRQLGEPKEGSSKTSKGIPGLPVPPWPQGAAEAKRCSEAQTQTEG